MNRFLSFIVGLMGFLLIIPDMSAQSGYEVRGTVTDKTGQPVIGATVLEKGTTNGLSTDIDGQYVLKYHLLTQSLKSAVSVIRPYHS